MNSKLEKSFLTYDEAVKRLPDGEYVHTIVNPAVGMLIGADWEREKLLSALKANETTIEETGEMAQRMDHGIAFNDGICMVFVATKK